MNGIAHRHERPSEAHKHAVIDKAKHGGGEWESNFRPLPYRLLVPISVSTCLKGSANCYQTPVPRPVPAENAYNSANMVPVEPQQERHTFLGQDQGGFQSWVPS